LTYVRCGFRIRPHA